MEWKVAPSYQTWTIVTINEETRKAYVTCACDKCGGSGSYAWFGSCFKCVGSGRLGRWVKIYTPEEYDKYLINQEKIREKKAAAAEQKRQYLLENSELNEKEALEKFGYDSSEPFVYIVVGENTYAIKDQLKDAGARFKPELGWYFSAKIEIPEGYNLVPIPFHDVFYWNAIAKKFSLKEQARDVADAAAKPFLPESPSEYIGEIKQRLRDLAVIVISAREIEGYYGTSTIYTFKKDENVLVWITGTSQDIKIGDHILLTGTVKDHKEYKGIKQTSLTRCIIKKEA